MERERLEELLAELENRIDDLATMVAFSEALCLLDHGAYEEAFEAVQDVQGAASGSRIVGARVEVLRDRAGDALRDRSEDEVRGRIGGLFGRTREPERPGRPAAC